MTLSVEGKIKVLDHMYPGGERIVIGDVIEWLDPRPYPTDEEFESNYVIAYLNEVRNDFKDIINECRANKLAEGLPYVINEIDDVIQTRENTDDKINIIALGLTARDLHALGYTDPIMEIMGERNIKHNVTPQVMITISNDVMRHVSGIYGLSWTAKKEAEDATTVEEIEALINPFE